MRRAATLLAFLTALAILPAAAASARTPRWAPAARASIHPGVQTMTAGAQCTANFVFYGRKGGEYIGQAAHCAGTGAETETDGCTSRSLPLNTKVVVQGTRYPGRLVYSSWLTMQGRRERDANACAYNDLALVRIDRRDRGRVNPSIPHFGGPRGIGTAAGGQTVYSYGNSELRGGLTALSPKQGAVVSVDGGGWSYDVYTLTPGVPGDSGSAFLNAGGQALGVLSTVALAPLPGSNGIGDIGHELAYLVAHGPIRGGVRLANGTVGFSASGN